MVYFVKFKYFQTTADQEPHKIQKYEVQNENFAELISLLPLNDGPFMIRYEDTDGDLCTIDNDSTLKVALKGLSSSSTLVLRVDYKPTTSSHGIKKENQTKNRKRPARRSARIENVKKEIKQEIKQEDSDSDYSLGSDDEGSDIKSDDDLIVIDDDDEEAEDWFEPNSDDSDHEYTHASHSRKRKTTTQGKRSSKKERSGGSKAQPATIEAVPDDASMPDAPEVQPSAEGADAGGASDNTKARIAKLLKTAYSEGNEHEQQQALKLAKRLLEKYNLTQADIEGKFTDESLPGGTAEVTLRTINKGIPTNEPPKQFERWWDLMAGTVALNFAVKCYITRRKGKIVFYGILKNCQTAAFAYSLAFNSTHVNQRNYMVPEGEYEMKRLRGQTQASKGAYTTNARRNYTLGVVNGLSQKVNETLREEKAAKAKRERKILRLQHKLKSKEGSEVKEAYKSDTESDSEGTVDLCSDSNDSADITENGNKFDKCIKKEEPEDVKPDVKELQDRVIKMEREEKARTALVLHSENIPDQVLKDLKKKDGLKIRKGRTFQKLKEGNTAAWQRGVKDGKEINLNQRAIRNEKDN